jgi:hypothetical protein
MFAGEVAAGLDCDRSVPVLHAGASRGQSGLHRLLGRWIEKNPKNTG